MRRSSGNRIEIQAWDGTSIIEKFREKEELIGDHSSRIGV
jgi:hypothetical protein